MIALPTHHTTPPHVSMTKRDAGEEFLSVLFIDDNSDDNSDFDLDASIHSGYLEGDSIIGNLLIANGDYHGIYRQSILQDGDNLDKEENGTVGNTGIPGSVITCPETENHALAVLINCNASGRINQHSGNIAHANPSARRGGEELGPAEISNKANQPLQSLLPPPRH